MSHRKRSGLETFFGVFGSAVAAAAAVSRGGRPRSRDLRALGIDPEQFRKIGR